MSSNDIAKWMDEIRDSEQYTSRMRLAEKIVNEISSRDRTIAALRADLGNKTQRERVLRAPDAAKITKHLLHWLSRRNDEQYLPLVNRELVKDEPALDELCQRAGDMLDLWILNSD